MTDKENADYNEHKILERVQLQTANDGPSSLNSLIKCNSSTPTQDGLPPHSSPITSLSGLYQPICLSRTHEGQQENKNGDESPEYIQRADRDPTIAANWPRYDLNINHVAGYEGVTIHEYVEYLLEEFYSWKSAKRRSKEKEYRSGMEIFLANLLHAYQTKGILLLSRNTSNVKRRYRNPEGISEYIFRSLTDYLAAADLIVLEIGKNNEYERYTSRCRPTLRLIGLLEALKSRIYLRSDTDLAVIRRRAIKYVSGKNGNIQKKRGKIIQLPLSSREINRLKKLSIPCRQYIEMWAHHYAELDGRIVQPWITRSFTESTFLGGRFYGLFQQIPSDARRRILIDGESTVELDYKSLHLGILYAREGLVCEGDPYIVEGFDRHTVKQVTLQLLNSESIAGLKSCVTRSSKTDTKRTKRDYDKRYAAYKAAQEAGVSVREPVKPIKLCGFIEGVPDQTDGSALVNCIIDRHSPIKHHFGTEDIGLKLQRKDSEIMATVLTKLAVVDIPVLPIHDSLRCRTTDKEQVTQFMLEACKEVIGQYIFVEEK